MYLSSSSRKQVIGFIAVRDILRTFSYNSYNKTSRACQRRLMYMLRQPRTVNSVALGVEEIKQDPFVDRRYGGMMDKLKSECASSAEYEKRVTEVFKELVGYIIKKYYDIAEIKPKKHMAMPKTAQEFNLLFEVVYPTKPHHNQGFTKDVRNANDIHAATINSVIHSSMCCGKDRRCWAYQLFKVYQQYPEILLRQAMSKIRSDQMVTMKKHHLASIKKFGNYMPMSSSQYQLSINYIHKLQTKWPYEAFKKSYDIFAKLLQWYSQCRNVSSSHRQEEMLNGTEILPVSCGIVTFIHDFLGRNQMDFDIEMPEQIIMLDARYQGKDETYFRVAQRYQDILTRLYRFKFENIDAQNADLFESERWKKSLKKKRPIENDDCEKPMIKIIRRDKECDGRILGKKSEQNEIITKSRSVDESIEELSLKEHSSIHKQNEKKICVNFSKKRSIDVEDDSMDYEESSSKRARLSSENSTDIEDVEKDEESDLCKNFNSIKTNTLESLESLQELKEQVQVETSSTLSSKPTNVVAISRRVNEIIRNVPSETSYFSPYSKLNDTNDIQKKYTRIAMLRMREELNNLTVADSHHAHEYFVVNSFKMFYNLDTSPSTASTMLSNKIENFKNYSVPGQLIPLRIDTVNDFVNKLNQTAIFPKNNISYMDYKDEIMINKKKIPIEWKYVDAVYKFVREKKEIGACSQELLDQFFDEQGTNLYKAVSLLTENNIFLRSGVTNIRYIHHRYVDSWLIHSYKIYRLEQESVVPFKDSIYATMQQGEIAKESIEINTKQNKEDTETDNAIPSTSWDNQEIKEQKDEKTDNDLNNEEVKKEDSEINEGSGTSTRKRIHKQRTCLLPQKDVYKSAQQLDFTTAQEIKVVIKPWIRIDGVLNRKVLDRMLGAVLSYCLLHPGITIAKVQSRFVPALQPFHTRELVEMLIKLGCLESKHMKKSLVSLFSRPPTIQINKLTVDTIDWFAEDEIVLEPAVDAIIKFSIFLSTRMYSTDFMP